VWNVVSNDFRTGVAVQPAVTVTSQGEAGSGGSTLSVTPGGPGPFTYQWYQGVSGDTSKPVGNGAATLAVSALGSSASYWVQITSAIGIIENSATVTPNGTITGAPASNTDAPLPIWGLGALGVGLIMIASRRAN
jgi:hypothetical protein